MSDFLIDNDVANSVNPSLGTSRLWCDLTTKRLVQTDDSGQHHGLLSRNFSTASQANFSSGSIVTGSALTIPSFGMQAGQIYRWIMGASKTAAGVAAPQVTIRIGLTGTTADTSRVAFNGAAQTAAISGGQIIVTMCVQSVFTGIANGIVASSLGFAWGVLGPGGGGQQVSSSFDNSALAGNIVTVAVNSGASSVWTISSVLAELYG